MGLLNRVPKEVLIFGDILKAHCRQGSSKEECEEHLKDSLDQFFSQKKSSAGVGRMLTKKCLLDKKEQ